MATEKQIDIRRKSILEILRFYNIKGYTQAYQYKQREIIMKLRKIDFYDAQNLKEEIRKLPWIMSCAVVNNNKSCGLNIIISIL